MLPVVTLLLPEVVLRVTALLLPEAVLRTVFSELPAEAVAVAVRAMRVLVLPKVLRVVPEADATERVEAVVVERVDAAPADADAAILPRADAAGTVSVFISDCSKFPGIEYSRLYSFEISYAANAATVEEESL